MWAPRGGDTVETLPWSHLWTYSQPETKLVTAHVPIRTAVPGGPVETCDSQPQRSPLRTSGRRISPRHPRVPGHERQGTSGGSGGVGGTWPTEGKRGPSGGLGRSVPVRGTSRGDGVAHEGGGLCTVNVRSITSEKRETDLAFETFTPPPSSPVPVTTRTNQQRGVGPSVENHWLRLTYVPTYVFGWSSMRTQMSEGVDRRLPKETLVFTSHLDGCLQIRSVVVKTSRLGPTRHESLRTPRRPVAEETVGVGTRLRGTSPTSGVEAHGRRVTLCRPPDTTKVVRVVKVTKCGNDGSGFPPTHLGTTHPGRQKDRSHKTRHQDKGYNYKGCWDGPSETISCREDSLVTGNPRYFMDTHTETVYCPSTSVVSLDSFRCKEWTESTLRSPVVLHLL